MYSKIAAWYGNLQVLKVDYVMSYKISMVSPILRVLLYLS